MRFVSANRRLRSVELAFVTFNLAEWATWIAILVFAFEIGGATASGLVALIQLLPAAVLAPFASTLGDRYPRGRLLAVSYALQAAAMATTGMALLLSAPVPVIYALAAVGACTITLTRPLQASLFPALSDGPEQLTAANVVAGFIESFGVFVGPAFAGVLLAFTSPGAVFVAVAALLVVGFLLVAPLAGGTRLLSARTEGGNANVLAETLSGFRSVMGERDYGVVVGVIGAQFIQIGALDILTVVLALSILSLGQGGPGFLNACFGVGGLIGGAATVLLVGRKRLAPPLLLGATSFGLAFAAVGVLPGRLTAPVLLVACGAGRNLMDVSGRTLLQRVLPDNLLARVFGVLEGLQMAALAVGAILVPVLVAGLGARWTFVTVGLLLPTLSALLWRRLRSLEERIEVPLAELTLLRRIPMFSALSPPVIEGIASRLRNVEATAGATIIAEGDPGDRFYVISAGRVHVSVGGRGVREQGPGEFFGEIALLRNVPRTATVTASSDVALIALGREDFLEAVTGHPQSRALAESVAEERLHSHGGNAKQTGRRQPS